MVDRISMLPDEVLIYILSFLSTEEAAATSFLAKRWKHLWFSVPVLDYDDEIYLRNSKPSSCFERFVYATILARQPITRFRLKYGVAGSDLSNTDINVWVNTVIRRGIENLDIDIEPQNFMISLSSCIFSCRTLVFLKLGGLSLNACSSVELPSLKTLYIDLVKFVAPKYLMKLLYGCPMLEDLRLNWLDYVVQDYYLKEEFKSLPKLVKADLRFAGVVGNDFLMKTISNVEFLSIRQYEVPHEVPEFPHLRHLTLSLYNYNWHSVLMMLKNCPKLQSFELNLCEYPKAVEILPQPHFVVPECLTSHFKECYLKDYIGTENDLQFAKYIMRNSTSLQYMKIRSVSPNPFEALQELALCPRKSASCELQFNLYW